MKKGISFREQIIAIVLVGIIVLVLFIIFLIKPSIDSLADLSKKQEQESQISMTKTQQLNGLKSQKEQVSAIEAKALKINKALPSNPDLSSLVIGIQECATDANLRLSGITIATPKAAGKYSIIDVTLDTSCTYFNLADFLYQMVKMPRKVKVNNVDIAISGEGYPLLDVSIKLSAFMYGQTTVGSSSATSSASSSSASSSSSSSSSTSSSSAANQ
ncbi:MAG: hypothetical protein C4562_01475 [Actinobacteria bacterium]|nr:MAG: hypothetical protein C4562_01475 [Actinomycetota bacterium]